MNTHGIFFYFRSKKDDRKKSATVISTAAIFFSFFFFFLLFFSPPFCGTFEWLLFCPRRRRRQILRVSTRIYEPCRTGFFFFFFLFFSFTEFSFGFFFFNGGGHFLSSGRHCRPSCDKCDQIYGAASFLNYRSFSFLEINKWVSFLSLSLSLSLSTVAESRFVTLSHTPKRQKKNKIK